MIKGNTTFAIEGHDFGPGKQHYVLCVEDGRGNVEILAYFRSPEAMAQFTRTHNLAMEFAHENGRQGV